MDESTGKLFLWWFAICLGLWFVSVLLTPITSDGPATSNDMFTRSAWMPFYGSMIIYRGTPLWSNVLFWSSVAIAGLALFRACFPSQDRRRRRKELLAGFLAPLCLWINCLSPGELPYILLTLSTFFLLWVLSDLLASLFKGGRRSFSAKRLKLELGSVAFGLVAIVFAEANNMPSVR